MDRFLHANHLWGNIRVDIASYDIDPTKYAYCEIKKENNKINISANNLVQYVYVYVYLVYCAFVLTVWAV